MLSDVKRTEVREEGKLLIEAVSLLVQRQSETESWIAEQVSLAEERATASERRYAELEVRLAGIEEHVAQLVRDVEPLRDTVGVDERLGRLREQVEGLKSSGAARTLPESSGEALSLPQSSGEGRSLREAESGTARIGAAPSLRPGPLVPSSGPATMRVPRTTATSGQAVSAWAVLGETPQDRFGLMLIAAGVVAVLYAILTQLRF